MIAFDHRLHAWRPDLADERLRGKVEASSFVAGKSAQVAAPVADLRAAPWLDAGVDTQLLYGDEVRVFERREGWAWVQAEYDGYVGYLREDVLVEVGPRATHVVTAPRSFLYPGPDLKFPRAGERSMGSHVAVSDFVTNRGTRYAVLPSGETMIADHLRPIGHHEPDYVAVAERLIYAPYLWGGTSAFGIDCSGLVQLAMRMAGRCVLRDTDMQAETIGAAFDPGVPPEGLRRGDLVFWKGHVAIMTDAGNVIHANGFTMTVAQEPLAQAIERIARLFGQPTGYRRPG